MSDDLLRAEQELAKLAAHIETVVPVADDYRLVALTMAHRARSLFLAFGQLMDSPVPVAAMTLVRPMVEINLLLRFLGKERLHVELWQAEGDRQRLALLDEYANDPAMRQRHSPVPDDFDERREALREFVKEARAKARAAGVIGVRERGPVFPSSRFRKGGRRPRYARGLHARLSVSRNAHPCRPIVIPPGGVHAPRRRSRELFRPDERG